MGASTAVNGYSSVPPAWRLGGCVTAGMPPDISGGVFCPAPTGVGVCLPRCRARTAAKGTAPDFCNSVAYHSPAQKLSHCG
mmetsp:Transcript_41890/g.82228  ORF Transcript_41890/g.82228 Transcript_41890/m.82228 type:complete len:81 (-) Transcript_41890:493-735(-)